MEETSTRLFDLGPKTFQLLISLTAPDSPTSNKFEVLTKLLKDHLDPNASEISKQHKFLLQTQHEGESIANYVAESKKQMTYCNFICAACQTTTNDSHLRSQFIRGIRVQLKADTNLDRMVEIALSIETANLESANANVDASINTYTQSIKKKQWSTKIRDGKTTVMRALIYVGNVTDVEILLIESIPAILSQLFVINVVWRVILQLYAENNNSINEMHINNYSYMIVAMMKMNNKSRIRSLWSELRRIFKKQKSEKSEFYFGKSEKSEKNKKSEKSEKKIKKIVKTSQSVIFNNVNTKPRLSFLLYGIFHLKSDMGWDSWS
jgi:hypothetical protein